MAFGDTLKWAMGTAGEAAKGKAVRAMASLADAAALVRDKAIGAYGDAKNWVVGAAAATATYANKGAQWAGEVVNTSAGLQVYTAAAAARRAKELYSTVTAVFGATPDAPSSQSQVVMVCPEAKPDIYSRAYRKTLVNKLFAGADNPRLSAAMHRLNNAESQADVDESLAAIAEFRERPLNEVKAEYRTYLDLKEQLARKVSDGAEPIDALKDNQQSFMGSTWQLRYGNVVGDKFGVDPVFGAMLNPTGGLVGPGNKGWAPDGALMPEAVAYHGAYHDAMGHLSNYFDTGPGYNYMGSPIGLSTTNPMAGQATGVAEWEVLLLRGGP